MPKRGHPPESDVKKDIKAAIAQLTVASQPHAKMEDKVKGAAEDFREQAKKYPGWRDLLLMDSPRTIYTLLKRFRSNAKK